MGLAMFAPSTALEAVTGFPVWASIVCTGVVAVVYSTLVSIVCLLFMALDYNIYSKTILSHIYSIFALNCIMWWKI